jgi:hypothetical protein
MTARPQNELPASQAFDAILARQIRWARERGLSPDGKGYLPSVNENLFAPLSAGTVEAFAGAAGNELADRPDEPAKMRALHSSSGLVCNVFDPWHHHDREAIARALLLPGPVTEIRFEAKLPSGLRGTPPTLDLLLVASKRIAWGIESKFTEPFQSRSQRELFAPAYFADGGELWTRRGLPRCQTLAEDLNDGRMRFLHLDAAQLLKHALGLRRAHADGQLLLLWYDVDAPEARALEAEIGSFASAVDASLGFRAMKHQEVFARLALEPGAPAGHVDYLRARYFPT